VVVGKSGGAVDAVIDQVTGLLVDGKNINEITDAICRLLADPAKAQAMGQAGRGWITSDWQISNWSAKFNELLIRN
jgi:phosphatidylinositol alpha-1,6-mannosyltransferase